MGRYSVSAHRIRGGLLPAFTCLLLVALHSLTACAAADVWVTFPDRSRLISWDGKTDFVDDATVTPQSITVDENTRFQTIEGFGASLTDSAAWLISRLPDSERNVLMQRLFGFEDGSAGISFLRMPLGASDLARNHYTYDDAASPDADLSGFSISHDLEYIIPVATQAKSINSGLKFLGSPWSAPAWMKTSNSLYGGKLNQAYYPAYATYFRKIADSFRENGVPLHAITVQNEPLFEPSNYPGMKFEWYDELNFVRDHLAGRLAGTGVNILTFDHNWDRDWYPDAVMKEGSALYAGSAWHCYAGSVSAMGSLHAKYPDKDNYLTECSGTLDGNDFGSHIRWNMQNMFIGGTKNWAKTVLLWSLALDHSGNPHTGGCGNCRGVVSINPENGDVTYNEEFYTIAHFARFVWPGASRVASTDSSDGTFIASAFVNLDGHKAVVVLNQGSSAASFKLIWNGKSISHSLPPSGVATVFWT